MKINNSDKHNYSAGRIARIERDGEKEKRRREIQKARKNKLAKQEFENSQMNEFLSSEEFED